MDYWGGSSHPQCRVALRRCYLFIPAVFIASDIITSERFSVSFVYPDQRFHSLEGDYLPAGMQIEPKIGNLRW